MNSFMNLLLYSTSFLTYCLQALFDLLLGRIISYMFGIDSTDILEHDSAQDQTSAVIVCPSLNNSNSIPQFGGETEESHCLYSPAVVSDDSSAGKLSYFYLLV